MCVCHARFPSIGCERRHISFFSGALNFYSALGKYLDPSGISGRRGHRVVRRKFRVAVRYFNQFDRADRQGLFTRLRQIEGERRVKRMAHTRFNRDARNDVSPSSCNCFPSRRNPPTARRCVEERRRAQRVNTYGGGAWRTVGVGCHATLAPTLTVLS